MIRLKNMKKIPNSNLHQSNINYSFEAELIALFIVIQFAKVVTKVKSIIHVLFFWELSLLTSLVHLWIKFDDKIYCPMCLSHNYVKCNKYDRNWVKFSFEWRPQRYTCKNTIKCKSFNIYSNTKYKYSLKPPILIEFKFLRIQVKILDFISNLSKSITKEIEDKQTTENHNQLFLSADYIESMQFLFTNCLNEVQKRLFAGLMEILLGRGSQQLLHNLLGIWPKTIKKGKQELLDKSANVHVNQKQRKQGGGRKSICDDKQIQNLVEKIVEDEISGNPEGGLLHVRKTPNKVCETLKFHDFHVCVNTVRNIYKKLNYSLKVNAKKLATKANHVLRDPQFKHIQAMKTKFIERGLPIVSVDGKKKEGINNSARSGKIYCKKALEVNDHSFVTDMLVPFGVYDVVRKMALIFCGTNASTAEFAVEALSFWWENIGSKIYENASEILVLCDGGGSNAHRSKLWKYQVQKNFADKYGITVTICHYPPGTSKWNPIEHCCFSGISKNWEGEPLITYDKALNLIRNSETKKCKKIFVALSKKEYKTGLTIEDYQYHSMNIEHHDPKPEWSYTIKPRDSSIIEEITKIDNGIIAAPINNIQYLHCGKTPDYWNEHFLKYYSHSDLGHDIAFLLENYDPIDFSYENEFWNSRILSEVCLKTWQSKKATSQNIRNHILKICWQKPVYSDFSAEYFIDLYLQKYPKNNLRYRVANLLKNFHPSDFKLEKPNWDINQLSKAYKLEYGFDIKTINAKIRYLVQKIQYEF